MCESTAKLYSEPRLLALTPPGRHKAAHNDVMDTTRSQRITMRTLIRTATGGVETAGYQHAGLSEEA